MTTIKCVSTRKMIRAAADCSTTLSRASTMIVDMWLGYCCSRKMTLEFLMRMQPMDSAYAFYSMLVIDMQCWM